jgi:hypothetical protein
MTWKGFSKYHAKKTEYNGETYDSIGEANLARDIDLLIRVGEVKEVERQHIYHLRGLNGHIVGRHKVDFVVTFKDGHTEIWEFKGCIVRDFTIRKKLFEDNYPDIPYVVSGSQRRKRKAKGLHFDVKA